MYEYIWTNMYSTKCANLWADRSFVIPGGLKSITLISHSQITALIILSLAFKNCLSLK